MLILTLYRHFHKYSGVRSGDGPNHNMAQITSDLNDQLDKSLECIIFNSISTYLIMI